MPAKNETVVTPKGVLKYPRLFTPDTKYKSEGEYKAKLVLTPEEAKPLIEKLKAIHKEAYTAECASKKKKNLKLASWPFKKETKKDEDDNEVETGNIEFTATLRARVTPKDKEPWDQRPQVFDAKKKPVPSTTKVGSGTTAKLALEVNPWFTDAKGFGIQLRLKAVQIIDLVEYSGSDASGLFDEEEGFEAPGETSSGDEFPDDAATGGDDEDDKPKSGKGKGGSKSADF